MERGWYSLICPGSHHPDISGRIPKDIADSVSQALLSQLEQGQEEVVQLQRDISSFLDDHRDFGDAWCGSTNAHRDELVLEGLVRTCDASADLEDSRSTCPESTRHFLQRDGGQGFLDLISTMRDPGAKPRFVPHAMFDSIMGSDPAKLTAAEKLVVLQMTVSRNWFLAMMVWNTILAFYGQSQQFQPTKLRDGKTDPELRKEHKTMYEEYTAEKKAALWNCRGCGVLEDDMPEGRKLLACAACNKIDRRVKYCSRECQKSDWKRHKRTCGKVLSAEEAFAAVTDGSSMGDSAQTSARPYQLSSGHLYDSNFPRPIPPFVHRRQLKHQIMLLKKNTDSDYMLTPSSSNKDYGVVVRHPSGRQVFLLARHRAMETGDHKSVSIMFQFLAMQTQFTREVTLAAVREQLVAEYGVPESILLEAKK
ncbi:hypothetical protein BKA62DRAFT_726616 [Auriculariales sp. MPI-PUGE-AT-0066]|nr:hypothetical protein BKA62DRAFT_726616 [Auriculariales sp. MPI-PUGE-AT-0066]